MEHPSIIQLKNANLFQSDQLVLSDVSFSLNKGEFKYIIGKTGAGKSTLLKTLYAELPLQEGSGSIVGYDLRNLKSAEVPYLRRKLGVVFQDFQLLMDRTVNENLAFVMRATGWKDRDAMRARVEEVLSDVGLKDKGNKMPYGLSGGEQQRIVVARAILNKPELILADEPTGNLDPETSNEVMKLLVRINKEHGTAILMASHDYYMIDNFPAPILKIADGKVFEINPTRAFAS